MFNKPILNYTGAELRAHLVNFVREGLVAYLEAQERVGTLQSYYFADIRFPGAVTIVDSMLAGWAEELAGQASRQNNDGTDAAITFTLPSDGIKYPWRIADTGLFHAWLDLGDSRPLEDYMAMLDRTLEQTDFEAMAKSIDRQAASLVDLGLKSAARDVADFMNLTHRFRGAKLKASGLEFEHTGGGEYEGRSRYFLQQSIGEAISGFVIAERETGIDGLEDGILAVLKSFNDWSSIEPIPSRTKFGLGPVTATVFKDKTKFVIASDVADALLSFVALHGDIEIPDLKAAA